MANKAIDMIKVRQILRLYEQGHSKVQISVLTGVARNTLKRYLRRFIAGQYTFAQVSTLSDHELDLLFGSDEEPKSDPRFEALHKLLPEINKQLKRKGMTLLKLWEQYREEYPDGYKITQFCYYHSQYNKGTNPVMHLEHKAGDKMYIDFAGEKLSIVDVDTGELRTVEVFAAILGSSQLTYVEAVNSQKKEDLILACENAMHFFGGVPAAIVPDNLKSAVTKSSKYEPLINETFADFAEHYGTAVIPARAYRPKDKSIMSDFPIGLANAYYPVVLQVEIEQERKVKRKISKRRVNVAVTTYPNSFSCAWEADVIIIVDSKDKLAMLAKEIENYITGKIIIILLNEGALSAEVKSSFRYAKNVFVYKADPIVGAKEALDIFIVCNFAFSSEIGSRLADDVGCHPVVADEEDSAKLVSGIKRLLNVFY